jgi:hypothetical protein
MKMQSLEIEHGGHFEPQGPSRRSPSPLMRY